jgi:hypothetical protein
MDDEGATLIWASEDKPRHEKEEANGQASGQRSRRVRHVGFPPEQNLKYQTGNSYRPASETVHLKNAPVNRIPDALIPR